MVSKIVEYGAVITVIVLAAAGVWEDFLAKKNTPRRLIISAILIAAASTTVVNQYLADRQHERDAGRINALSEAVDKANQAQQVNARTFSTAQESARVQFLAQFNEMSQRVADLQTGIKTANLQKEADQLRADLNATQKALAVPKATLEFSFAPCDDSAIHAMSLPRDPSGNVTVRFTVMNFSNANALDGFIMLQICDQCSFVKEPDKFNKLAGQKETQRNYDFDRILPMQSLPDFEFTMHVPPAFNNAIVAVNYRCKTCVVPTVTNRSLPDSLRGIVYFLPGTNK